MASDADSISFGGGLWLYGKAFIDDLELRIVGANGQGNEAARPLSERGVENLTAFGRLLGYVQYFHPSDEAAANDWNSFAIIGIDQVEGARTPTELKERLERLFRPLAPTMRLSTKGLSPITGAALRPSGVTSEKIIGWRHLGYEGYYPGYYEGRRILAPAGASGDSLLPIGSEVNTALSGGVWCSIPLALYTGPRGTIPAGRGPPRPPRRPGGWVPTGNDRATRLADVILFWNAMQHFWPYFDVTGTDWPAQLGPALQRAAEDVDGVAFEATLRQLTSNLHDGHIYVNSTYRNYDPRQWPFAWSFVENALVLTRVDSAFAGGARVGDHVLAIQGRPTLDWVEELQHLESAATKQHMRVRVASALLARASTDTIALDLRSSTGAESIRRVRLTKHRAVSLTPARPASVAEVRPGVWYLDLSRISLAEFKDALPRFSSGKGVIFDMRGYPYRISSSMLAHLTDAVVRSPQWGVPKVLRPDHRDTTFEWKSWSVEPESPRIRARAAFLIDGSAISAAETTLGIVEHHRLADLVGEPTAGTNGVVNTVLLPGRYSIPFTGMRVLKQNGSHHHGVGILPTVPISPTVAGVAAGRDEQLERAIEIVSPPEQ